MKFYTTWERVCTDADERTWRCFRLRRVRTVKHRTGKSYESESESIRACVREREREKERVCEANRKLFLD